MLSHRTSALVLISVCLLLVVVGEGCVLTRRHLRTEPVTSTYYDDLLAVEAAYAGPSDYIVYFRAKLANTTSPTHKYRGARKGGVLYRLAFPRSHGGLDLGRADLQPVDDVGPPPEGFSPIPIIDLRELPLGQRFRAMRMECDARDVALYLPFTPEDTTFPWNRDLYRLREASYGIELDPYHEDDDYLVDESRNFHRRFGLIMKLWDPAYRGIGFAISSPRTAPSGASSPRLTPYLVRPESVVRLRSRLWYEAKLFFYGVADGVLFPVYVVVGIWRYVYFVYFMPDYWNY